MFAASVEGLTPAERGQFIAGLSPRRSFRSIATWSCRTCTHSSEVSTDAAPLRSLAPGRPALRSVPALDPQRVSAERLAAIIALGGDVDLGTGA